MNWKALKDYKCPQDGADLHYNAMRRVHECKICPFVIAEKKFNAIVADLHKPKHYHSEEENLAALNNL